MPLSVPSVPCRSPVGPLCSERRKRSGPALAEPAEARRLSGRFWTTATFAWNRALESFSGSLAGLLLLAKFSGFTIQFIAESSDEIVEKANQVSPRRGCGTGRSWRSKVEASSFWMPALESDGMERQQETCGFRLAVRRSREPARNSPARNPGLRPLCSLKAGLACPRPSPVLERRFPAMGQGAAPFRRHPRFG